MSNPELIDELPDLVLLVKRDGTPIAHAGGRAVAELYGRGSDGQRLAPEWSESTATLIRRLARNAIADRRPLDARFREREQQYEIRVSPQGPDRAVCVIRPAACAGSTRSSGRRRAARNVQRTR